MRNSFSLRRYERGELEDGVPVASGPARAQFLFDERTRQTGAADAVGIDDVGVLVAGADDLAALDHRLQRVNITLRRRALQHHRQQAARIAQRVFTKWIVLDQALPLRGFADEKISLNAEPLHRF